MIIIVYSLLWWIFNSCSVEADDLKKFKESSRTLGQEVIDLKAKLNGMTHQTNELAKKNVNLKSEVAALHEHMDKVKEEVIKEYQMSQPYFNQNGGNGDSFKDFRKQVVLMFLNLDIFKTQIKFTAPMTLATNPIPDNLETDDDVLVTNEPSDVADNPVDP